MLSASYNQIWKNIHYSCILLLQITKFVVFGNAVSNNDNWVLKNITLNCKQHYSFVIVTPNFRPKRDRWNTQKPYFYWTNEKM